MACQQNAPTLTDAASNLSVQRGKSGKRARLPNEEDLYASGQRVAKQARWSDLGKNEAENSFVDSGTLAGEFEDLFGPENVDDDRTPLSENPSPARVQTSNQSQFRPTAQSCPAKDSSKPIFASGVPNPKQSTLSRPIAPPNMAIDDQKSTRFVGKQQKSLNRLELPGGSHFVDLTRMKQGGNPSMPPVAAPTPKATGSNTIPSRSPMPPTATKPSAPVAARSLQQVPLHVAPPKAPVTNTSDSRAASAVARSPRLIPQQAIPSTSTIIPSVSTQQPSPAAAESRSGHASYALRSTAPVPSTATGLSATRSLQGLPQNVVPPKTPISNPNPSVVRAPASQLAARPSASVASSPHILLQQIVPSTSTSDFAPPAQQPSPTMAANRSSGLSHNHRTAAPADCVTATSTANSQMAAFAFTAVASSDMVPRAHATSNPLLALSGGAQAATTTAGYSSTFPQASSFDVASSTFAFGAGPSPSAVAPNATIMGGGSAGGGQAFHITSTQSLTSSSSTHLATRVPKKRVRVPKECDKCGRVVTNLRQHQRTQICQTETAKRKLERT
ncbi:hypothetical protein V5O48_011228 [Marasmius crinis-equi]|uniref:Uncharacterized protein n=1 Tax=Marasmius crinis-equi TaxID=585013 RepID=A0ABR3F665_9AGAR